MRLVVTGPLVLLVLAILSYDGGEASRFRFFLGCVASPSEEEVEAESDESDSDSEKSV